MKLPADRDFFPNVEPSGVNLPPIAHQYAGFIHFNAQSSCEKRPPILHILDPQVISESFCNGNTEITIYGQRLEGSSERGVRSHPEIEHRARGGPLPAEDQTALPAFALPAPSHSHRSASVAAAAAAYSAAASVSASVTSACSTAASSFAWQRSLNCSSAWSR